MRADSGSRRGETNASIVPATISIDATPTISVPARRALATMRSRRRMRPG